MEILNYTISYLLSGIFVSFILDLQQDHMTKKGIMEQEFRDNWGIAERLIVILLWPIAIIIFLKALLK